MSRCEVCNNEYDKSFTVVMMDKSYVFDCFECAIHKLAPTCGHCGCRIIGHGVEGVHEFFCCNQCARAAGAQATITRA